MTKSAPRRDGHSFGTFKGVYTPSILTILGVVMYLRFPWVLGSVGLPLTIAIVTLSVGITAFTGLSIAAMATNMKVGGGGACYMISRTLGVEVGTAVGLPRFLAQALGIAFYVVGFSESVVAYFPSWPPVAIAVTASDAVVALGHRISLSVRVTPDAKNHVYAPGQKGYIRVALTLPNDAAFKTFPVKYQPSSSYVFAPLKETVQVYSRPFTVTQDVTLALTPDMRARAARGDLLTISGALECQTCDDKVCHRPEALPVEWRVTLSPLVRWSAGPLVR